MTPHTAPGILTEINVTEIPRLCGVDLTKLQCRKPDYVARRYTAMALMVAFTDLTYREIGGIFGKDHATVTNCLIQVSNAIETNYQKITEILVPNFNILYLNHLNESGIYKRNKPDRIKKITERLQSIPFSVELIKMLKMQEKAKIKPQDARFTDGSMNVCSGLKTA